jgi:hypothetical protein
MASQSTSSILKKYFVLADSHATFVPRLTTTTTHEVVIQSISGLKWIDDDQHHLSAFHLLQTYPIFSCLASANAVLFLIGSNSLRKFTASTVIHQVHHILHNLRQQHPHLVDKTSLGIVTTFPCFKVSYTFPTPTLLQNNISSFNEQLYFLATHLHFTVADFAIQPHHLRVDLLHLNTNYSHLVPNNIFHYFNWLNTISTPTCPHVSCRSADAIQRRNRHCHLRFADKQANFYISRTISPSWTLKNIKTYLQQHQIPFAKLSPIRNTKLRIRFNNLQDLQACNSMLPANSFIL